MIKCASVESSVGAGTSKQTQHSDGGAAAADCLETDPFPLRPDGTTSQQHRSVCLDLAVVCMLTHVRGPLRTVVVGQLCQVL